MTHEEATMSGEPLRTAKAAQLMGIPTKDLLRLIYDREIRFVMLDGIAHIPQDAIDEFQGRAAS